jgi:hypothetical protein
VYFMDLEYFLVEFCWRSVAPTRVIFGFHWSTNVVMISTIRHKGSWGEGGCVFGSEVMM